LPDKDIKRKNLPTERKSVKIPAMKKAEIRQTDFLTLCEQIADGLEQCCLTIDEAGRQTKNEGFQFPAVISLPEDVKDSELYDIDTEKLLSILEGELKDVLPYLRHQTPANAKKIETEFYRIKKWAISLHYSGPRPSTQRYPRMADYHIEMIGTISHLTHQLPETANELRRVARLLKDIRDSAETKDEGKLTGKPKTRHRSTKAEIENRNRTVARVAAIFKAEHDHLPSVDDIVAATEYSRQQVYYTNTYKEGKIAKESARAATQMTGGSVAQSEHVGRVSEQRSRVERRSRADQDTLDALIDEQSEDNKAKFVK